MSASGHEIERLVDLLDNRLSEAESAAVRRHLDGCSTCRQELDWLAAGRSAARSAASADAAPADVRASIVAALDAVDASGVAPSPRAFLSRRVLWAGVAAAAAVTFYLAGPWRQTPSDEVDRARATFAAVRDDALALTLRTSDAGALERFFAAAPTSVPIRVIDLGMMGWTLEGGVSRAFSGQVGAVYAYRSAAGTRLVCQMYPGQLADLPAGDAVRHENGFEFRSFTRDGVTLVFWQEGELVCVLAADLPAAEVLALAVAKAMAPA